MKFDIEAYLDIESVPIVKLGTKIGDRTLKEFRCLREIRFPEGLEIIGNNWFINSEIEKVTIPGSVREI